jgi:ketosteroid isomerase-like protein
MKRTLLPLLATAALLTTANAQSTLKEVIQNHYNAFSDAVSSKDAKFFESYFQPGVTVTFPNHEIKNRDDILKGISDLLKNGSRLRWTNKVGELHMAADGVLVQVQSHFSGRMKGDDKKNHRLDIDGINADTWTQDNNKWVLKRIEIVRMSLKVDGKPMTLPNNQFPPVKP